MKLAAYLACLGLAPEMPGTSSSMHTKPPGAPGKGARRKRRKAQRLARRGNR